MSNSALDLNTAIRDLIDVVRTADLDSADITAHTAAVQAIADELRPLVHDGPRMQAALKYGDLMSDVGARMEEIRDAGENAEDHDAYARQGVLDPSDFFPYSPVIGALNPISPPIRMWRADGEAGQEVHGEGTIGAVFNGPPDFVHGGFVAAVMDELLGCVCVTNGIGGFTGTLTVVYRAPTPLNTSLRLRGWHDRTEGRKVFAKGTIHNGDTLCAEAEGIFIRTEALPTPPGA